jgi:5,10-methylenetetrahydromethanopterin reductase
MGLGFGGTLSLVETIRHVQLAESMGFDSIWLAEHYGASRDPVTTVAALASSTRRIRLATGVVNPYTRHPAILAITLGTLDELSRGRVIFGLGAGNLTRLKNRLCVTGKRPLTHVEETVTIVRRLLTGRPLSYNGKVFQVADLTLGFDPIRAELPVYVGAVREQMLRLAARVADGVLLSTASSPSYVAYAMDVLKRETERLGRDFEEIDVACNVLCCVSEDPERARAAVKPRIIHFLARPARGEYIMDKAGLDRKSLTPIRQALQTGDRDGAAMHVDDEMVDRLSITGTPDACMRGLRQFREAGVTLPIVRPVDGNYQQAIRALGASG